MKTGVNLYEKFKIDRNDLKRIGSSDFLQKRGLYIAIVAILLVASFMVAVVCDAALESFIVGRTASMIEATAPLIAKRPPSVINAVQSGMTRGALHFTAWGVPESTRQEQSPINASITEYTLVGTMSNVAAWLRKANDTSLILVGQELSGFKLDLVDEGRVVFQKDGKDFPLFMAYAKVVAAPIQPSVAEQNSQSSQIQPAAPNGSDGTVARELVNELLSNPIGEIQKFRMSAISGDVTGMQVLNIQNTSLLNRLGVEAGDTIVGINGMPITDMSNVANAINSMLAASRFDVEVVRGGNKVKYGYAIK